MITTKRAREIAHYHGLGLIVNKSGAILIDDLGDSASWNDIKASPCGALINSRDLMAALGY